MATSAQIEAAKTKYLNASARLGSTRAEFEAARAAGKDTSEILARSSAADMDQLRARQELDNYSVGFAEQDLMIKGGQLIQDDSYAAAKATTVPPPPVEHAFTDAAENQSSGGEYVSGSAMTFVTDNAEQKTVETTSSLLGTFGGIGDFSKLGANLPSFDKISSGVMLAASGVVGSKITSVLGSQVGSLVQGKLGSLLGSTPLLGSLMGSSTSAVSSVSASQVKQAAGVQTVTSAHRVSLREIGTKNYVYFEVMPEIVEAHTAEYESVAPAQFPGAFQKYKGNSSTAWTLNITFISRTTAEATQNYDNLLRLRGWMKPFYGDRTGISYPKKLGAPPPVLMLEGLRDLVGPVPVVITSMNWNWPKDVDYIATDVVSETDGNYIPFPVVLQLPIQLSESYSIDQFNQFSLTDYRTGRLGPAFNNMESDVTVNVDYVDGVPE